MNENINVAEKNAQAQEQVTRAMGIEEMLWKIQTMLEVKKTKPQGAKFEYYSLDDIMEGFHKVQKIVPCTLTLGTEWHRNDEANAWICIGKARLTSIYDPNDYKETQGVVFAGFSANLGSMEQRTGGTNTYAKKEAVKNLFGLTEEQLDPDAMPQTPTTSRGQKQTVKNTTLQSAQAPKTQAKAQPVQQKVPTPAQAAPVQEENDQTTCANPITFVYPGDGVTMQISTIPEPLTFPKFSEPVDPMEAMKTEFHMSDQKFSELNGKTVQDAMKVIFGAFDVARLHLLSNYIKNQTGDSPAALPEKDVITLKCVGSLMTLKLGKEGFQKQS